MCLSFLCDVTVVGVWKDRECGVSRVRGARNSRRDRALLERGGVIPGHAGLLESQALLGGRGGPQQYRDLPQVTYKQQVFVSCDEMSLASYAGDCLNILRLVVLICCVVYGAVRTDRSSIVFGSSWRSGWLPIHPPPGLQLGPPLLQRMYLRRGEGRAARGAQVMPGTPIQFMEYEPSYFLDTNYTVNNNYIIL